MAWPPARANGFVIDATAWNQVVAALSAWGGTVNAGGNDLGNLGNITFRSGAGVNGNMAFSGAVTINGGNVQPALKVTASGSASPAIILQDSATTPNEWQIYTGLNSPTDGIFAIEDVRQAVTRLVIDTSGKVGIGTTSPYFLLSLGASAGDKFAIYDGGDGLLWGFGLATNRIYVKANGGEVMTWVNGGNVGIGDNAPAFPLCVRRGGNIETSIYLLQDGIGGARIGFPSGNGTLFLTNTYFGDALGVSSKSIALATSGFVGIGTASPYAPLDVVAGLAKTTATPVVVFRLRTAEADINNPFDLKVYVTGGATNAQRTITLQTGEHNVANAGNLSLQQYGGFVGIGTAAPGSRFTVKLSAFDYTGGIRMEAPADTNAWLQFIDGAYGYCISINGPTPVFRITSTGNVGIGNINPIHLLQLAADDAFKPGTNTWGVISDVRTKRNIQPYDEGLETILKLRPQSFEYTGEAGMPEGMQAVGLVAQEVADIIPSCMRSTRGFIGGVETDVLGVNSGDLTWMMVNAIQEIDARLKAGNL